MARRKIFVGNDVMSSNAENAAAKHPPLATDDQIAVERLTAQLLRDPRVIQACEDVGRHWQAAISPNAEEKIRFADEARLAYFGFVMHATNDDPLYPRVHAMGRIAHTLDGYDIPAVKCAHPNPDYIYRFVPIDGVSRYLVDGRITRPGPVAFEFAMLTAAQGYQRNMSLSELVVAGDGSFTITVDPDPADGRPNHFQSNAESFQLLIRDVISDAAVQLPIALKVRREGLPPERGPLGFEDYVARAGQHVRKQIDDLIYVTQKFAGASAANVFAAPEIKQQTMYSAAQAYSAGNFRVADDEALVISLTLGSASYAVVPVTNRWGGLGNFLQKPVSIGTGRARPNPDGSFTFVLAHRDPGVANWVDPDGLHEGIMFIRWIGFKDQAPASAGPSLSVRLLHFSEIETALPSGVPRLTVVERQERQAAWRSHYAAVMG